MWHRSVACESGSCVEVHDDGDLILMRNSDMPEHVLSFTRDEWLAFLAGAKVGEFDL